jgi:hypothetical protein
MKFLSYFANPNRFATDCGFCGKHQEAEAAWSFKKDGSWMTACWNCYLENHGAAPTEYEFNTLGRNKQRARGFHCGECQRRFGYIKSTAGKWYAADVDRHVASPGGDVIIAWRPHHKTCGMTHEEIYAFEKENQS